MNLRQILTIAFLGALVASGASAEEPSVAIVGDTTARTGTSGGGNGNASLGLSVELAKFGLYAVAGYGVSSDVGGSSATDLRKGIARAVEGGYGAVVDLRVSPWGSYELEHYEWQSGVYGRVRVPFWKYEFSSSELSDDDSSQKYDFYMLSPRATLGYWANVRAIAVRGGVLADSVKKWDSLGVGIEFGATARALTGADKKVKDVVGGSFHVGVATSFYILVNSFRVQLDVPCFFSSGLNLCAPTVGVGGRADLIAVK
jgi:hypothetical protein